MKDPRLSILTTRDEARRLVEEHQRASKQANSLRSQQKEGAWKRFLSRLVVNARKHHEERSRAPMT